MPVAPSEGMLLVRARLELQDGSVCRGFLTPAFNEGDLGAIQPQIFVANERFGFWGGMFGYRQSAGRIFPVRFAADPGLATGAVSGSIDGFCRRARNAIIQIER